MEPEPQESIAHDAELLAEARMHIEQPGEYLLYEEDGETTLVALTREWTRVGRSLAADVRFDDPTVSRRHALLVRQPDGVRVLDDRSLNGVFVNGERVEWRVLEDGDEIVVGRYRLRFLSVTSESILSGSQRGGGLTSPTEVPRATLRRADARAPGTQRGGGYVSIRPPGASSAT